jgi:predicted dehydrogenase
VVSELGLGVAGAGLWGRNWAATIRDLPGSRLVRVVDPSAEALSELEARVPGAPTAPGLDALLDDPEVGAVVLATPTPTHVELARRCLLAGKDVLVEKPLSTRSADARAVLRLAEQRGRILMVGHLLLFHPAVRALLSIAAAEELGPIRCLTMERSSGPGGKGREGAWTALASHDVAIANAMLGGAPEKVRCDAGAFAGGSAIDLALATLTYPGGVLVQIHASRLAVEKTRRVSVFGADAVAIFDDVGPGPSLRILDRSGEQHPIPDVPAVAPLRAEAEAFAEAVRRRRLPDAVSHRAVLDVVRVLEAGARSIALGGAPVDVMAIGEWAA